MLPRCSASSSHATTSSRVCSGTGGTTPGLNFLYAHLNRVIAERSQRTIYIAGPGHGGPGMVANSYLDGTYTDFYPEFRATSRASSASSSGSRSPAVSRRTSPRRPPGSIHEGGELGYSLLHAYGAAFDNPDLLVFAVVGDGEAETGPLATSWHSNKFLNPVTDGVVLPVLHLNGFKIANPTVLARIPEEELAALMEGYGHRPYIFTAGFDDESHTSIHRFASLLDEVLDEIADIRGSAAQADAESVERPRWPMIVFPRRRAGRGRRPSTATRPRAVGGRTRCRWRAPATRPSTCTTSTPG